MSDKPNMKNQNQNMYRKILELALESLYFLHLKTNLLCKTCFLGDLQFELFP